MNDASHMPQVRKKLQLLLQCTSICMHMAHIYTRIQLTWLTCNSLCMHLCQQVNIKPIPEAWSLKPEGFQRVWIRGWGVHTKNLNYNKKTKTAWSDSHHESKLLSLDKKQKPHDRICIMSQSFWVLTHSRELYSGRACMQSMCWSKKKPVWCLTQPVTRAFTFTRM